MLNSLILRIISRGTEVSARSHREGVQARGFTFLTLHLGDACEQQTCTIGGDMKRCVEYICLGIGIMNREGTFVDNGKLPKQNPRRSRYE